MEQLLLTGLMFKEIAARLGVTFGTVHAHIKKIYRERGVHGRRELVEAMRQHGGAAAAAGGQSA